MFRRHQREMDYLGDCIRQGMRVKTILAKVTPGGGKSLLPQILCKHAIPSIASKVCWVVPRLSLQEQAAESFLNPANRTLTGCSLEIRESTNDNDPSRGLAGYATTYNAIATNPDLHRMEFERHRYILVLDEPHHVEDGGVWHRALEPLVGRSAINLLMSGTLERNEGGRCAFVRYREVDGGFEPIEFSQDAGYKIINYSRTDALQERAILPIHFQHVDGSAEFMDEDGFVGKVSSLAEAGDNTAAALYTALSTQYATHLLERCLEDWWAYKSTWNPRAKMLVVCHRIEHAKRMAAELRKRGESAEVATSDEPEKAADAIKRFKSGSTQILVTVAMAYEGMDVPAVSHIACLTHIRSKPWIEQMLNRATRVDKEAGAYESQRAVAFVPDDQWMVDIIERMRREQNPFIREIERRQREDAESTERKERVEAPIAPIASAATRERSGGLDCDGMDYQETKRIKEVMQKYGFCGASPVHFKQAIIELGLVPATDDRTCDDRKPLRTAGEREDNLRTSITTFVSRLAKATSMDHQEVNTEIMRKFGKRRPDMTEIELSNVLQYLQQRLKAAGHDCDAR